MPLGHVRVSVSERRPSRLGIAALAFLRRQTAVMQVSGGPYSSNFQAHLDRLQVPRQRRSGEVLIALQPACAAIW